MKMAMKLTVKMMTNKPINIDKVQIKFLTKSSNLLDTYPDEIDILFDLASDAEILNGLNFDYNYARYVMSCKISKQKYLELIESLIKQGFIEKTLLGKKLTHKLIKHPWE